MKITTASSPLRPPAGVVEALFEERVNRFVVRVRIGERRVEAYLPNTARLRDLLTPGAPLFLQPVSDPARKTGYTVVRFSDNGVLVGAEAAAATEAFATYLRRRRKTPFGPIIKIEREVNIDGSRLDFRLVCGEGPPWWIEVKSLSRVVDGVAHFSGTPSSRGWEHLRILASRVERGDRAAAVFVVQREDAKRLAPGRETDPGWVLALQAAVAGGVRLFAYSCRVTFDRIAIARQIPVSLDVEETPTGMRSAE